MLKNEVTKYFLKIVKFMKLLA